MNIVISDVVYRKATIDDAAQIREIMTYYVDNTTATWRYQVKDIAYFENYIAGHHSADRPFWVAEYQHQVVGYSCLSEFRAPEGYWPCAENSVYVRPEFSQSGIGSRLMELIIDDGRAAGLQAIIAAIDGANESSINFHKRFGFEICGELKNIAWKQDSFRTLILMQLNLQKES